MLEKILSIQDSIAICFILAAVLITAIKVYQFKKFPKT